MASSKKVALVEPARLALQVLERTTLKPEEVIYDWLLSLGIREPAVLMLGSICVIGRWLDVSTHLDNDYVCRAGRLGIHVLGEGATWEIAREAARLRLTVSISVAEFGPP